MIELRIGKKKTGFFVIEDDRYPGMYRVKSPDGKLSDMVNLTRAKDAARCMARPGGTEVVYWDNRQTCAGAGVAAQLHSGLPDTLDQWKRTTPATEAVFPAVDEEAA